MTEDTDCPMEGTEYKSACALADNKHKGVACPYASECRAILQDIQEKKNDHDCAKD